MRIIIALFATLMVLAACATPTAMLPANATVTGTVTYTVDATLPADATVTVELIDLTLQPAPGDSPTIDPAAAVGRQQIATNGSPAPFAFEIGYSPAAIDRTHQYGVSARIADAAGTVLFASTAYVPAITNGAATQDILVTVAPVTASDAAAATSPLTAATWEAFLINDGKGALVNVINVPVTARFGIDGTVTGSGGCNDYTASYMVDAGAIKFGPIAVTQKACSEPAGIMEQESQYFAALTLAVAYQVQNDTLLELEDGTGESAVQFSLMNE